MDRILACIDGSGYSDSVADHSAWAASKLGLLVELLRVLPRADTGTDDLSGSIAVGARRRLLEELSRVDGERAKLEQQEARLAIDEVQQRVTDRGVLEVTVSLRKGDLLEAIAAREPTARLVVVGKRGQDADLAKGHLGSNLERVLRSATKPVLVASRTHRPIRRVLVAYDGRAGSDRAVSTLGSSALLDETEIVVMTAGAENPDAKKRLASAAEKLAGPGRTISTEIRPGGADTAVPDTVAAGDFDLVVMGAYGHSPLRALVLGSTTAAILGAVRVSALVYR